MAAISITTNLTVINNAEPGTLASWSALGGGSSGLAEETDFAVQGQTSISKQVKLETKGMMANNGAGISLSANAHIYTWLYATTPGVTNTRANGGLRVVAGTGTNAYKEFYVNGRDNYKYGGWVCYPVQYSQAADSSVGNAGASPQYFGGVMSNIATVRGINFGVDVIRYGDRIIASGGGAPDADITFAAVAAQNDLQNNAWGIMQGTDSGVNLQGKLAIGIDNASTPTSFVDVDAVLVKPNNNPSDVNQKTASNFSGLVLAGTGTNVSMTGCTFISLDTVDRGFVDCDTATNGVTSASFTGCTFLDWGRIGGRANVLFDSCSFKGCAQMILNGSSVDGSTYQGCDPLDAGTNLGAITNTSFVSSGTGHAITTSANTGSLSFVGNKFTGYGANSSADAAIHFTATSGSVTINISGGGDVPTFLSNGVSVNIVSASTLTFNDVVNGSEIRIYNAGTTTELDGIESVVGNSFSSSISVGSVDAVVFNVNYLEVRYYGLVTTSDQSIPVQQTLDRQYQNP